MDRALMTAWTSAVGPDDTVLNGGDVALAGSLGERGRARVGAAPGRKLLAVGNLHGHVHNNEPLRTTPHINVCVEQTDYRPVPLESLVTLAKLLLAGNVPDGATTGDRIRNADWAAVESSKTDPNGRSRTQKATG